MRFSISYRRDDGIIAAGVLSRLISERFGSGHSFLDLFDIPPGVDFRRHIETAIRSSDVLLVLIGPNWRPERLSESGDMVHFELAVAEASGLTIVPVLIPPRSSMPGPDELPADLRFLCYRNAFSASARDFEGSIVRLLDWITAAPGRADGPSTQLSPPPPPPPPAPPSLVGDAAAGLHAGVVPQMPHPRPITRTGDELPLEIATSAILLNLSRTWSPAMTPDELYERTRGAWRCWGERRELTVGGYGFGFAGGVVRSAFRIKRWRERTLDDVNGHHDIGQDRPRMMFESVSGAVMLPEDLQYVGKSVRHLVTNPQLAFIYLNC